MTRKLLTGTYASGYSLHSPVTIVTLAATGYVGGSGITSSTTATLDYLGRINGSGTVNPAIAGVFLGDGGLVTNGAAIATSARIAGYRGVDIQQSTGTVTNFGTILASERSGVLLDAGDKITNGSVAEQKALLSAVGGVSAGIFCDDFSASTQMVTRFSSTITNFGTITGYDGVEMVPGSLINGNSSDASALIKGSDAG